MSSYGKCMWFPHKFSTVRENATKSMIWGKSGKLILILFPQSGWFFPIRFPFYSILHHMRNACFFSLISHKRKIQPNSSNGESLQNWFLVISQKTHCMWRTWEIGIHTFPTVWVLFSIRFPSCGVLHHIGNAWVFSSNLPQHSETHQLGNQAKAYNPCLHKSFLIFRLGTHLSVSLFPSILPSIFGTLV